MSQQQSKPNALSVAETTELAERLADLSKAGLPLSEGLRAAAEDTASLRLAGVLRMIAAELDCGVSLDVALGRIESRLPAYVQGVVRAGIRSGELTTVLTSMAAANRHAQQVRSEIRLALIYPVILLVMMAALLLFVVFIVLPQMEEIYADLDTRMPTLTGMLLAIGHATKAFLNSLAAKILLSFFAVILFFYVAYRVAEWLGWSLANPKQMRPAVRATNQISTIAMALRCWPARLLSTFPLVGPMFLWGNVASWSRLLAVLVEARVPMAEALVLSAQGMRSANLANLSQRLAEQVRGGSALSEQIRRLVWLPMSMVPITEWGEKSGQLPEALRTVAEIFEQRVRLRASLIKQVAPPLFFIVIAALGLFILAAIFMALLSLIQYLT